MSGFKPFRNACLLHFGIQCFQKYRPPGINDTQYVLGLELKLIYGTIKCQFYFFEFSIRICFSIKTRDLYISCDIKCHYKQSRLSVSLKLG